MVAPMATEARVSEATPACKRGKRGGKMGGEKGVDRDYERLPFSVKAISYI